MSDLISRQALCEYALNQKDKAVTPNDIMRFPSADRKQVTGKLNNRDDSLLTGDTETCKEQKSKLDLISRQDAIEAIAKRIYHIEDGNENDALRKAICDIDALPSVNAIQYDSTVTLNSPTIIKATSTDLISRQDALDAFNGNIMVTGRENANEVRSYIKETVDKIMALPSADRPTGEVDAVAIYEKAEHDLEHGRITLGEFEKRIEPLKHLRYDRPTGEWVKDDLGSVICSECKGYRRDNRVSHTNFCNRCGAKMGGDTE